MQSVSSRIWTRVAVSISYDDNDYTTGTSNIITDRKPTILYYRPNLSTCPSIVNWNLAYSPEISIILSLYLLYVGLLQNNIELQICCLPEFIFCFDISDFFLLLSSSFVYLKENSQHLLDAGSILQVGYKGSFWRSWHPDLLCHILIWSFFSWVVYCSDTRPRGCLNSAHQSQKWPSTIYTREHFSG